MYRTTAYVGHFLARFERDVKLYMACAALIGFSAFDIYSVLFNLYLLRMDYDVGLIGHFNAAGLLSFALFSPVAGNWTRRAGYRRTLVGGMSLIGHGVSAGGSTKCIRGCGQNSGGYEDRYCADHRRALD